jgi:ribosomal protein L37AE/L43A
VLAQPIRQGRRFIVGQYIYGSAYRQVDQQQDDDLVDKVGRRLYARCLDILMVSDGRLACPECQTEIHVPWIGESAARVAQCPHCAWSITAGAFHASFEHQDLLGINARGAFAEFVEGYPEAHGYPARMLLIDRLVHAVHAGGGPAARNLLEGRPRQVLAILDTLASGS